MREVRPCPAATREIFAALHGQQCVLGDGLLVEQEQPFNQFVTEDARPLAKDEIAALVELCPASAGGQSQFDADHGEVQALAGFAEHSVFRLAGQGGRALPLEGAQLFDDRFLRQSTRHEVGHAHVQAKRTPGRRGHRAAPVALTSISRASASIVHSRPTISTSWMRTPNWRSMPAKSSVALSEST